MDHYVTKLVKDKAHWLRYWIGPVFSVILDLIPDIGFFKSDIGSTIQK
jgi:hypothetical protein